jgi:glycosyltransferase involved in cell wall biosynthesis
MKVLFSIHLYPPFHLCGAEFYAHNINKYLVSKGHEVRIVLHQAEMHNIQTPYEIDGVKVFKPMGTVDQYSWADVIITHLDFTQWTTQIADIIKRPVVFISHNTHPYECVKNARKNLNVIYNAKWAKELLNYQWPSLVFTPPVDYRYYDVCENPQSNQYISLINLDENKGGWILKKLAQALPDKKFLGITGSYSEPFYLGQCVDMPSNVTIMPKQADIRPIYQQTRILLMLSRYESWGMTATEAMCNGIPVIATPTPGLKENLAGAGLYVPPRGEPVKDDHGKIIQTDAEGYDINPIVKQIKKLDSDSKYYKVISELSRKRSRDLDPHKGLAEVESFLHAAASSMKPVAGPRRPLFI